MNQNDEQLEAHAFGRMWDALAEGRSIPAHPDGPALLDTLQVVRALEASTIDLTPNPTFVRRLETTLQVESSRPNAAHLSSPHLAPGTWSRPPLPRHSPAFESRTGRRWGRWSAVAVLLLLVTLSAGTLLVNRFNVLPSRDPHTTGTTIAAASITSQIPTPSETTTSEPSYGEDAFFAVYGFPIDGEAMAPTLHDGNIAIVDRDAYQQQSIGRGDIVVLDPPVVSDMLYIKRVIGLPNEKIEIRDYGVYVNDQLLDEPYLDQKTDCFSRQDIMQNYCGPWVLGDDEVFVLGDNRQNSSDSRVFGAVKIDRIKGKVLGESAFFTP